MQHRAYSVLKEAPRATSILTMLAAVLASGGALAVGAGLGFESLLTTFFGEGCTPPEASALSVAVDYTRLGVLAAGGAALAFVTVVGLFSSRHVREHDSAKLQGLAAAMIVAATLDPVLELVSCLV